MGPLVLATGPEDSSVADSGGFLWLQWKPPFRQHARAQRSPIERRHFRGRREGVAPRDEL